MDFEDRKLTGEESSDPPPLEKGELEGDSLGWDPRAASVRSAFRSAEKSPLDPPFSKGGKRSEKQTVGCALRTVFSATRGLVRGAHPMGLLFCLSLSWALTLTVQAQETERLMLSGSGYGDTVNWEFTVSGGRRSGEQATIPVPSHWEQHGFGSYNYGHDEDQSREEGRYRHRFRIPESWRDRVVDLIFEGVMTDAEVHLNGAPAGPVHRGSFYRFRYDVTALARVGDENLLEVTVRKHSSDGSVNRAERDADYWVFGGIYRPVILEARPRESIGQLAIDARHDGGVTVVVTPRGLGEEARVVARIETLEGMVVGQSLTGAIEPTTPTVRLTSRIAEPRPWSAESPNLYRLVVELKRSGLVLHRRSERFGFRSIEVRPEGIFVNEHRVMLKGVNRHAFWPASGRTLNRELDRRDAELIKRLNMNAVRMSHYPPDSSFLEACDELGLYVIDELAGWHDAYRSKVGRPLVRQMVERDVNHPSIILWANGNEGGWNTSLDEVFAEHDPQRRPVIHPDAFFGGLDTEHYLSWEELEDSLDPASLRNRWRSLFGELPPVLPTEILHGLYDGGHGAGLADYWRRLRTSPRGAGLFLWSFTDEAIERSDRAGALDTDGNHAPDGILGPYRELTGNFYAVRELFSPVVLEGDLTGDGSLWVENRFDTIDLASCRFEWAVLDLPAAGESSRVVILDQGTLAAPAVPAGGRGRLILPAGLDWRGGDALSLKVNDSTGRELWTWVLPTRDRRSAGVGRSEGEGKAAAGKSKVEIVEAGDRLVLKATAGGAEFDRSSGTLRALLTPSDGRLAFSGGPRPSAGGEARAATSRFYRWGEAAVFEVLYELGLSKVRWMLFPSGWLRFEFQYSAEGRAEFFGVRLDTPRENVERFRWLGGGPTRVWKNRLSGARLGLWEKNPRLETLPTEAHEPKIAGFYANVHWAELLTLDGSLTFAFESPDLFLGLFSPPFPDDAQGAVAAVPSGGINFLHGISAIGTKFHAAAELGPESRPNVASGSYNGVVWLRASKP